MWRQKNRSKTGLLPVRYCKDGLRYDEDSTRLISRATGQCIVFFYRGGPFKLEKLAPLTRKLTNECHMHMEIKNKRQGPAPHPRKADDGPKPTGMQERDKSASNGIGSAYRGIPREHPGRDMAQPLGGTCNSNTNGHGGPPPPPSFQQATAYTAEPPYWNGREHLLLISGNTEPGSVTGDTAQRK